MFKVVDESLTKQKKIKAREAVREIDEE